MFVSTDQNNREQGLRLPRRWVTNLRRLCRTARHRRHRPSAQEHHPQRDRSRLSIERPSPKVEGCRSRRTRLSIPVSYGWLPKGQLLRAVSLVHVQRGHQDAHLQGGGSAPAAADQNSDLLTPPGRYFRPETHPSASFVETMAQGGHAPLLSFLPSHTRNSTFLLILLTKLAPFSNIEMNKALL